MSGNFTLFQPNSSSDSSGSGDYVKDAFEDISLPPTNNTGLSSTVSKNPLGQYFANDGAPKYGIKTLWVKDLVLVEDRTKWVNQKPTYQVIFHEDFPGAYAYVAGNVRLRNRIQGISVDLRSIDDVFGVTGVIRRVMWILNPTESTGTADILVDGTDTTRDVTFGTAAADSGQQGYNVYNAQVSGSSNEDHELHDYQIRANEDLVLNVAGIQVYYELSTSIEAFAGVTYVDKTKVTSSAGATLATPTVSGRNGAISTIYRLATGGVTLLTVENQSIATVGVGLSGQNTIDVSTGHGASFPIGTGVAVIGASHYLGRVTGVSTDTLTVFPTLAFGLSNVLYKTWRAGATLEISPTLYQQAFSFDPGNSSVWANLNGFGQSVDGDFYYTDPYKRFRAWGDNLRWSFPDGQNGLEWQGASGFLQFAGFFQAAEIEYSKAPGITALLDCNIGLNGVANALVYAEGVSGTVKKTVFTEAGPGWNQFTINVGATQTGVVISKVNFYQARPPVGVTAGHLSYIKTMANEVMRGAVNATMSHIGTAQRIYSDDLYFTGGWVRGTTHTSAGGVHYLGASTNSVLKFQYYGSKFGIVGAIGSSCEIVVDGGAIGATFNVMHSLATGFHTVTMTNKDGTTRVEAVDFMRSMDEITSMQNFLPREELDDAPTVYNQSATPLNPKDGDIWMRNQYGEDAWIYLFKRWNKLSLPASSDDPNLGIYVRTHGTSSGATAQGVADTAHFNLATWATGTAGSAARAGFGGGDASYNGGINVVDGYNTSDAPAAYHQRYNLVVWASLTASPNPRVQCGHASAFALRWENKGMSSGGTAQTSAYAWNGSAWATKTVWGTAAADGGAAFQQNSLLRMVGGDGVATHETRTSADSVSTDTVLPVNSDGTGGADAPGGRGVISRTGTANGTTSYSWAGSWSSAITAPYSQLPRQVGAQGFVKGSQIVFANGGQTATTSNPINTSERFNGVSYTQDVASTDSRGRPSGGVI
jgi:hypothetical protein